MVQRRIDPLPAVLGESTEQEHPQSADALGLEAVQHAYQPGEEGARPVPAECHIEIWKADSESDDLAVFLDEGDEIGKYHRLELLGQMIDLVLSQRNEAPISLPPGVVELFDPRDLGIER